MIAFSYVIAGLSVYMVNERINGEKLQQKLCGISFLTYWGVSFVWDMMVIGHSEKLDFIYLCKLETIKSNFRFIVQHCWQRF